MSFLSQPKTFKLRNTYVNGFLDCSGDVVLRAGNVIIGNISQPGYNANQLSVLVHGRTQMNGNVIVNGNLLVSSNNIALGLRAGNIVNGIQDGVPNGLNTTAVGSFSGMNHTGLNNTFVGSVAGQTSSTTYLSRTGSNNTYLGYRTSANNTAWGNSTAVGTGAVITASNQIVLGTAEEIVTTGGNVRITNQTNSINTTSGALQVSGGVGVGGSIIAGGSIYAGSGNNRAVELSADAVNTAYIDFHSLDAFSNDYDSRIKSVGGTSGTIARGALSLESESLTITGNTTISKTTASTMSTNGALVVTGGLGVGGAINAAGLITATGGLTTGAGSVLTSTGTTTLTGITTTASKIDTTIAGGVNSEGYKLVSTAGDTAGYNKVGLRIYPYLSPGAFSYLPIAGDAGIIWGSNTTGTNSGFVIAPHTNNREGIRINADKLEVYYITPMYVTPSFPTSSIGYTISQSVFASVTGGYSGVAPSTTLPIGVWLIEFKISATTSLGNFLYPVLTATPTQTISERRYPFILLPGGTEYIAGGSMVLTVTTASVFQLFVAYAPAGGALTFNNASNYSYITLTRIA